MVEDEKSLNVRRVCKHVIPFEGGDTVLVFTSEHVEIELLSLRIAGHVHDAIRSEGENHLNDFLGQATARRVDDERVDLERSDVRQGLHITSEEQGVANTIERGVDASEAHSIINHFQTDYGSCF